MVDRRAERTRPRAVRAGPGADGCPRATGSASASRAALQHDPDIIVLDEPTNALDPAGVILLREALLRRAAAGAGVLVSSHHLDEVARVADRITVINAGRPIGTLDPHGVGHRTGLLRPRPRRRPTDQPMTPSTFAAAIAVETRKTTAARVVAQHHRSC